MVLVYKNCLYLATFLFGLSFLCSFSRFQRIWPYLFGAGLLSHFVSIVFRYLYSLPLLCMFQSLVYIPFFIGLFSIPLLRGDKRIRIGISGLVWVLAMTATFFPKDFYIPFIESKTVFSHLFFLFGVFAKSCFFIASVLAFLFLLYRSDSGNAKISMSSSTFYIILGFAFLTVSMFSGELWSYLGWGSPVVWDDPAITAVMGIWFYYICYLHLHFMRKISVFHRAVFVGSGFVVLVLLGCYPDMGPFFIPRPGFN